MAGTLYIVATPLGNLEDISSRALRVLSDVSLIACEDTRHTRKLLSHFRIGTRTTSYHEHNEVARARQLVSRLVAGQDVALVTDAGTPTISDPGFRLVRAARERALEVRTVPGPSAPLAALAVSGLPSATFCFHGFLPTRPAARRRAIESLARTPHTILLFESPRRIASLLRELAGVLGSREAMVAREMTKVHESYRSGTLEELADWASRNPLKGEVTLVISGRSSTEHVAPDALTEEDLAPRFHELLDRGLSRREAAKHLSRETGLSSRRIYRKLLPASDAEGGPEET